MSRNADVYSVPSFRVVMAPGSVAKVGPFSGQLATTIKLLAGGTLEIGGLPESSPFTATGMIGVSGAVTFSTTQTAGNMYVMSSNEAFSVNSSGEVYLYCTGITCVVGIASGRSAG